MGFCGRISINMGRFHFHGVGCNAGRDGNVEGGGLNGDAATGLFGNNAVQQDDR